MSMRYFGLIEHIIICVWALKYRKKICLKLVPAGFFRFVSTSHITDTKKNDWKHQINLNPFYVTEQHWTDYAIKVNRQNRIFLLEKFVIAYVKSETFQYTKLSITYEAILVFLKRLEMKSEYELPYSYYTYFKQHKHIWC